MVAMVGVTVVVVVVVVVEIENSRDLFVTNLIFKLDRKCSIWTTVTGQVRHPPAAA